MPSSDLAYARAVNAYFRARATAHSAPFALLLSPDSAEPYANYAIPIDEADPGPAEIAALVRAFSDRGRVPRLEYAPEAAPLVDPALRAAGFAEEARPPLLTLAAGDPIHAPPLPGVTLRPARDRADYEGAADALAEAFGVPLMSADDLARTGLIVAEVAGGIVGAGSLQSIAAAASEVAGIGVRPGWRRRGIAQGLTAALAVEGFARGAEMLFLSAADDAAASVYARAGFQRRAPMLFLSRPG